MTRRLSLWAVGLAVVAVAFVPRSALGQPSAGTAVVSIEQLADAARAFKKNKQYEEAIQAWVRVLAADRGHTEARGELAVCVRLALQANRHRDPAFQARLLSMSHADVLALYGEVLQKLEAYYVDVEKVGPDRLFRQGMDEFLAALGDKGFQEKHLKGADDAQIAKFRGVVRKAWMGREIASGKQAVEVVAEIGSAAKRMLGLRAVNAVVGEFICGACNSLDEYSAYLSAGQYLADSSGGSQSSVEAQLRDGSVVYLRITHFQPTTPEEVEGALKAVTMMGGAKAIVLDLRGNTGGLFTAAVKTAEKFLSAGVIVTSQGQHNDFNKVYASTAGAAAWDLPMVVLIDGTTASAAEVLAIALRDNGRAKLVGTATYGKGSVQNVIKFTTAEEFDEATGKARPRAAVRITLARLIAPSGNPISGVGVTPDAVVPDRDRQTEIAFEQARELARRYAGGMTMSPVPR